MALTLISAKMPQLVDPTRATQAFGNRALPRMNKELKSKDLITRQRALNTLSDYLHDPEHIAQSLNVGIPSTLKTLLSDSDNMVRAKSIECLYILASHAIGRDALIDFELILPIAKAFKDLDEAVVLNAHRAIQIMTETSPGAIGIVEAGLIPELVGILTQNKENETLFVLDTLHFTMFVSTDEVLQNEGMEIFTNLLSNKNELIREKSARNIMDLSVPLAGKDKAVEVKAVEVLVGLLSDDKSEVRSMASGALMMISVTTKGKYTCLEFNAIDALLPLLKDSSSEVRANVLKALTCLAETPEGRKVLLSEVDQVRELMHDIVPNVVKSATIAIRVITWKP